MKSFFSKKSILRTMAVAAVCMLGATSVKAQEFTIQGDFVSSYVWRGIYQGGAASFQPTLGFSVGNFSLTAWGSTSLSESNKEIDLTAAYKFGETGPALSVATLWWDGQGAGNYFHFKSGDTGHHFEAGLPDGLHAGLRRRRRRSGRPMVYRRPSPEIRPASSPPLLKRRHQTAGL